MDSGNRETGRAVHSPDLSPTERHVLQQRSCCTSSDAVCRKNETIPEMPECPIGSVRTNGKSFTILDLFSCFVNYGKRKEGER